MSDYARLETRLARIVKQCEVVLQTWDDVDINDVLEVIVAIALGKSEKREENDDE